MRKIFCTKKQSDQFIIEGEDARHIAQSLRMKPGDQLTVGDGCCIDYDCLLETVNAERVVANICASAPTQSEPSTAITLYQALPKGDKFEFILQKAVELGVHRIVPVITAHCIARPDQKSADKKILRWQKIAKSAAEQSGRGIIPAVHLPVYFEQSLDELSSATQTILCYENGGVRFAELIKPTVQQIALFIGPEGGFSTQEVLLAEQHDMQIATLGTRILRCETAPIVAVSIIMNLTGNI